MGVKKTYNYKRICKRCDDSFTSTSKKPVSCPKCYKKRGGVRIKKEDGK